MKKCVLLLASVLLILGLLAGCGNAAEVETTATEAPATEQATISTETSVTERTTAPNETEADEETAMAILESNRKHYTALEYFPYIYF